MEEKLNHRILNLAFLGDAVLEVNVRRFLVENYDVKLSVLHKYSTLIVSAKGQSKIYERIKPLLNEMELDVLRKGKNAKKVGPKRTAPKDYQRGTAIESLFGYLYVTKNYERISQLIKEVVLTFQGEINESN